MSKLETLVQQLCPDRVEYKKLNEVVEIKRGIRVVRSQLFPDGKYPVYQNSLTPLGYYEKSNVRANTTFIIAAGAAGEIGYSTVDFWAADDCFYFECGKIILNKYIYYLLLKNKYLLLSKVRKASIPRLSRVAIEQLLVPVPPLEIQREIVRILDNFTELTAELTEKLIAELTARKKQYEYYRNRLLTFGNDVPTYKLGDVLTFLNGRAYKQSELLSKGKYPVLRVGNFYTNDSWYYSDLELTKDKYCDKGDLLYSWAATLGPKIWTGEKCVFHYHIWKIIFDENTIDKNYLYYYLQNDLAEISNSTTKSTMIHVSMASMKERMIKLPSIKTQRKIAALISSFDRLCTDISCGLPAEIEARKKQYEYYRDKLLQF